MNRHERRAQAARNPAEWLTESVESVDDFLASGHVTDGETLCTFVFGYPGHLRHKDAVHAANKLRRVLDQSISPQTPVCLSMLGFDDDPRELWEIPEARDYLSLFATEFDRAGIDPARLLKRSRDLIDVGRALAAGAELEVTVLDGGMDAIAQRFAEDVEEFRNEAKKGLN